MKEINAYKCDFCSKVYQQKKSCSNHENKCYFNPKTRSCASCGMYKFLDFDATLNDRHTVVPVPICLANIPISKPQHRLKTQCEKYVSSIIKEDKDIMDGVYSQFDKDKATKLASDFINEYMSELPVV